MKIEWKKYKALCVGIIGYDGIMSSLIENPFNTFAKDHKIFSYLTHDYTNNSREAWDYAKNGYDIFFIDATQDVYVIPGRLLSEAIKELYPNSIIVGLSMQAAELEKEKHNFDALYNPEELADSKIKIIKFFQDFGFLPHPSKYS